MSLTNDEKMCLSVFNDITAGRHPECCSNRVMEYLIQCDYIDAELGPGMAADDFKITENGQKFYRWLLEQEKK